MISMKRSNPISRVKIPYVSSHMLWEVLGCECPPVISSTGGVCALCSLQKLLEGGEGVSGARQLRYFQAGFYVGLSCFIQNSCSFLSPCLYTLSWCDILPKINHNGKLQLYQPWTRNHEHDLIWDAFIVASFNHPFHAGFHQHPTFVKSEVTEARLLCELT